MGTHVVCLTKGGGWESCLASEALEAIAVGRTMISRTVCTRISLGWCDGLSGGCCGADVLGGAGVRFRCPLAVVRAVRVVRYLGGAALWWDGGVEAGRRTAPIAKWAVVMTVMNVRIARGPGDVVGYVALNIHAEFSPGLIGVVVLAISLCEDGVWCENGRSEGEHDGALDCRIRRSMIHDLVVWVKQVPCDLCVCLVVAICEELS